MVYGSIVFLFRHSLSCFFSGIGKTRIVMISAIVTMCVNVVINYILIFGRFGFPALGIEGAAYGSIIAAFVGVLVLLVYFLKKL